MNTFTGRRDMDLIRQMLLNWVENESCQVEGFSPEKITEHGILLVEAGLMEAHISKTSSGTAFYPERITWRGHDFLDAIENDGLWADLKDAIKTKVGAVSMQVMMTYAAELAKQRLGL